jgi:hypothetical protein
MWQSLNVLSWPETLFAGQNKAFSLYNHYTTAVVKRWLPESLLSGSETPAFSDKFPTLESIFFLSNYRICVILYYLL